MTALETVRAAIERLEQERDSATGYGPWEITPSTREGGDPWFPALAIAVVDSTWDACIPTAPAKLIVTLHRTIDAQLAILREGERVLGEWVGLGPIGIGRTTGAVLLARAILGEDT